MKKFGLLPQIIIAIILGIALGKISPDWVIKTLATFNGIFGNFLGFAIPLIIIGFIAPGIGQMGKGAGRLLGLSTFIAYGSTIIAGLLAFLTATFIYPKILKIGSFFKNFGNPEEALLPPFFKIEMPPIMGVMAALIIAFILGVGISVINGNTLQKGLEDFRDIIEKLISAVIIPLLPMHILGIFANMTHGGQVEMIISVFGKVFVIIIGLHVMILLLQYTLAGALMKRNPISLLKIMMPAYFTALGTQSSASTIPVTLRQIKEAGGRDKVADFTVPLFATIHLSGSTITLVCCSMAVMLLSGTTPTFAIMLPFILMLGVTMIAAPGVPGGAVMAALGLLKTMLDFDPTMLSLMIALYLAQDSFGTACNVTGDGALTIIVDKLNGDKKSEAIKQVAS